LAVIVLAACGQDPAELTIPPITARKPIDTSRLNSNVFDGICHIGNPFAVVGWDNDAQTRFLYFVGPFTGAGDGATHPYMYMAIPAPGRATINTTLYLDRLDQAELRRHAKPSELDRFQLPHIVGLPVDADETRRQLGEPAVARKLESGRERLIFARDVCLRGQRLAGLYIDVDGDRLVAAKGIEHPDRLNWLLSAGRPPQPDQTPIYYQDWKPREGTAQAAAVTFMLFLEAADLEGAHTRLWQSDSAARPLESLAQSFAGGATIDTSTLTYQTRRYGLDHAEVEIAFVLSTGRSQRHWIELRTGEDERWLVSDWRAGAEQGLVAPAAQAAGSLSVERPDPAEAAD
jgi:hypothetical protein